MSFCTRRFTPIHEHPLGWEDKSFREKSFPYGVTLHDVSEMQSNKEGQTWAQAVQSEEDREKLEQARQAAEARYSGMFGKKGLFGMGGGRLARDQRRLAAKEGEKGYIKNDAKRAAIAQAVAGEAMNSRNYSDSEGTVKGDRERVQEMERVGEEGGLDFYG